MEVIVSPFHGDGLDDDENTFVFVTGSSSHNFQNISDVGVQHGECIAGAGIEDDAVVRWVRDAGLATDDLLQSDSDIGSFAYLLTADDIDGYAFEGTRDSFRKLFSVACEANPGLRTRVLESIESYAIDLIFDTLPHRRHFDPYRLHLDSMDSQIEAVEFLGGRSAELSRLRNAMVAVNDAFDPGDLSQSAIDEVSSACDGLMSADDKEFLLQCLRKIREVGIEAYRNAA